MNQTQHYRITLGNWLELKTQAIAVREIVFIQEQRVPRAMELDEFDRLATHAIVTQIDGSVVGTARVVKQSGERLLGPVGRIGRLAVLKPHRRKGLGNLILTALIEDCLRNGLTQFELHARLDAKSLYEPFGFKACGDVFDEAGAEHVLMVRR